MSALLKAGLAAAVPQNAPKTVRVRVAVRVRPFLPHETNRESIIQEIAPSHILLSNYRYDGENLKYTFDTCYDEKAMQSVIFHTEVKPLLRGPLQGQNTTCFAFGPTGAGKTHTMQGTPTDPGIIPLSIQELFFLIKADSARFTSEVTMSYLEIYNEKVYDLLDVKDADLPIREDQHHNIIIPGLSEAVVTSYEEFEAKFASALLNRSTAPTKLNNRSSRSHAVLMIKITRQERSAPYRRLQGKVNLIDLAGSEDNRKTENQGARLKESGAINMSLFVLGKVVDALNQGAARVPFRDSKLTRLLQDSLGGDARACILANIAPCKDLYFDTYNSLNFASKSRNIVNKPTVHQSIVAPQFERPTGLPVALSRLLSTADDKPDKPAAKPGFSRTVTASTATASNSMNRTLSGSDAKESNSAQRHIAVAKISKPASGVRSEVPATSSSLSKTAPLAQRVDNAANKHRDVVKQDADVVVASQLFTPGKKAVMAKTYVDQAQLFEKAGNPALALEQYHKAIALLPGQPTIAKQIARLNDLLCLRQLGNKPTAAKKAVAVKQGRTKATLARLHSEDYDMDDSADTSEFFSEQSLLEASSEWSPARAAVAADDDGADSPKHVPAAEVDDPIAREAFVLLALKMLNEGDVKKLMQFKGIGKVKAEKIVECRNERGHFTSINDLKKVGYAEKGIENFIKDNMHSAF